GAWGAGRAGKVASGSDGAARRAVGGAGVVRARGAAGIPTGIVVAGMVMFRRSACETREAEADRDAAGDEERRVLARKAVDVAQHLVAALFPQRSREAAHVVRQVGDVFREVADIVLRQLRCRCLDAVGQGVDLSSRRAPCFLDALLAFFLGLLAQLLRRILQA